MKVWMNNWAGEAKNLPEWFNHDQEAEVSFLQIEELFNTGNNVMLVHRQDEVFLFVDSRRFTQR